MKELQTRTITGIVFLVAVIGSILLHPIAFFLLFSFFTIIGLKEFYRLQEKDFNPKADILFYLSGVLIYSLISMVGLGYIEIKFLFLGLPIFFLQILFELYRKDEPNWRRLGTIFSAFIFVSVPFGLMNTLFFNPQTFTFQSGTLIGLFAIIWTNDVFAYLTGSKFGKHKLFERHSPKKSWEGSIGGFIFAMIAAYILSIFYPHLNTVEWIIMGAIIAISGTFGDLAESLLKRNANIKDSGTIFPGHGGVLDRFDAVLFASPFVFVYINLI